MNDYYIHIEKAGEYALLVLPKDICPCSDESGIYSGESAISVLTDILKICIPKVYRFKVDDMSELDGLSPDGWLKDCRTLEDIDAAIDRLDTMEKICFPAEYVYESEESGIYRAEKHEDGTILINRESSVICRYPRYSN